MIPVDQTRTGYLTGNCMAAAIASVLEVPLSSTDFGPMKSEEEYKPLFDAMLERFGLIGTEITASEETMRAIDDLHPGVSWVVGVTNPRGLKHVVVWKEGRATHDPNPLRDSLSQPIETVLFLTPKQALHAVVTEVL